MLRKLARAFLVVALALVATARAQTKLPQEDLQKLLESTDEIAKTVGLLRALPIKRKIPRGVMSKEEITKRLVLRMEQDYAPGELAGEERTLKRLGLLGADVDYKKLVLALLTEQIAGFYDPQVKELYIADWIDAPAQRMVMAHEIDHALQDQSFDLQRFMKPVRDNGDEQLARQALAEGDGVALMIEFMLRDMGQKIDPWADDKVLKLIDNMAAMSAGAEFDRAPLFLKATLLFPYEAGLRFIADTRRTHPWADVDNMYRRPPISTEQVIHPEKYRAGEKPVVVKPPALATLKGWKRVYANVVGELLFSVFLRQHGADQPRAERAAAGWGGDRLELWAPPKDDGKSVTALLALDLSVWDAEMDAIEAFDALADVLPSLAGAQKLDEKTELYAAATDASGKTDFVERAGAKVALVIGVPKDIAAKVRAELWGKWK
jgi:hypothetical protein